MIDTRGFSLLAVLSLATLVWTGCGGPTGSGTTKDGNKVTISDGGGSANAIDSSNKYPAEVPISQYPGSVITLTSKDGQVLDVLMTSTDDFDKVAQFYQDETKAKGWTVKRLDQLTGYLMLIVGKGQQGLTIKVVGDQEGGKADSLTIAIRMQPRTG